MSFMALKAIAGRPIDRLNIRGCLCLGLLVGRRPDRIKRVEHIPHNVHVQSSMRVPSFHPQLAALGLVSHDQRCIIGKDAGQGRQIARCVKTEMRDWRMVGRLAVFDCRISTDLLRSMSF